MSQVEAKLAFSGGCPTCGANDCAHPQPDASRGELKQVFLEYLRSWRFHDVQNLYHDVRQGSLHAERAFAQALHEWCGDKR